MPPPLPARARLDPVDHLSDMPVAREGWAVGWLAVDLTGIDRSRIPRHVAAVMDGNGRWATQRGLKRTEGHAAGEEALFDTLDGAIELGLDW
ncbi:MAG TPA: undecaprenyl diphosphate synthase family protein, partial [Aquihabitans sp.]|nr:undecaprenyl diphosphate synthase family protein [Aquihabitans sp.]